MANVYLYVVARDFGFAPNPFHGMCTLATCKPAIRNTAQIGDWIFGLGGTKLKAVGKCIYAMKVTDKITYNQYWEDPTYNDKKPVRNGTKKMIIGDNIYHYNEIDKTWFQAHSHHSNIDGTINAHNLERDTHSKNVLISKHFYYFGNEAPIVPEEILRGIGYKNKIGHNKYDYHLAKELVDWIELEHFESKNLVLGSPFNFDNTMSHYSVETNRVTK